jgi:hypothetical protein
MIILRAINYVDLSQFIPNRRVRQGWFEEAHFCDELVIMIQAANQ